MAYPSCLQSPPLRTDRLPSGRRQLVRDLIVCVDEQTWTIPQGTDTDYSSIPAIGRFVVRWSRVDIAGVIHDWLYQEKQVSRRYADRIWRLVAQRGDHRANALQAFICWVALRIFGGWAWGTRASRALAVLQIGAFATLVIAALCVFLWWWGGGAEG